MIEQSRETEDESRDMELGSAFSGRLYTATLEVRVAEGTGHHY
jgi:hypothetical protein